MALNPAGLSHNRSKLAHGLWLEGHDLPPSWPLNMDASVPREEARAAKCLGRSGFPVDRSRTS